MKYVVDRNTLTIIQVPDDYIECSMCYKWAAPAEFRKEGETHQSRTNCTACHDLGMNKFQARLKWAEERKADLHNGALGLKFHALKSTCDKLNKATPKEQFIKELVDFLNESIPDGALVYDEVHFDNPKLTQCGEGLRLCSFEAPEDNW